MLDLNILNMGKYYDLLYFEHWIYVDVVDKFIKDKKAEMSAKDKFNFWLFKRSGKGYSLGNRRGGFMRMVPLSKVQRMDWNKHTEAFEFADLYYKSYNKH